jgi:hypothetical protein
MRELIVTGFPWLLSASTIYTMFLAGNKSRNAWLVALISQALWAIWIIASETWGMVPGHIALWIVYTRNHLLWSKN